jgi:hypothetical protein
MTGTQSGVVVDFICTNIDGQATCTGVVQNPTVVTVDCSRVTDGFRCSPNCEVSPIGECFDGFCFCVCGARCQ